MVRGWKRFRKGKVGAAATGAFGGGVGQGNAAVMAKGTARPRQ